MRKPIQLVSIQNSSTKWRWRKTSSHQLLYTQQDHMKIYLAYAKDRRHLFTTQQCEILHSLGSKSRISPHPIGWIINTQSHFPSTIWKIWIYQSTFCTCTSTCTFSGTHDRCLKGFSFHFCIPGWHNHLQHDCTGTPIPHQTNFQKRQNAHLPIKLSKCHFFTKEIQYLGHILSTTGIRPLLSKTETINNMHPPKTAKQALLGHVGYYRKFIKDFAKMAKP